MVFLWRRELVRAGKSGKPGESWSSGLVMGRVSSNLKQLTELGLAGGGPSSLVGRGSRGSAVGFKKVQFRRRMVVKFSHCRVSTYYQSQCFPWAVKKFGSLKAEVEIRCM